MDKAIFTTLSHFQNYIEERINIYWINFIELFQKNSMIN